MITASVLICVIATTVSDAFSPPGLKVRNAKDGVFSYINLAQNTSAAECIGWVLRDRPRGPLQYEALTMMCREDNMGVCVLYDQLGHAAGLQVAIDKKHLSGGVYDMQTGGFTLWTTCVNGHTKHFWTSTVYFVSSDSVCLMPRDPRKFLQESCVYVTGFDGNLIRISTNVTQNEKFTQQGCVPGVGVHHFYDMCSSLQCTSTTMLPWFFFTKGSDFAGVGIYSTGRLTSPGGWKWLERWNRTDAVEALEDGPSCFFDIGDSPGYIGIKIFVIDNPEDCDC